MSVRRWSAHALTMTAGATLLAISMRLDPRSTGFYVLTAALAVVWFAGARLLGARKLFDATPKSLTAGLLLGVALTLVFVIGASVLTKIPALRDPVLVLLSNADGGAIGLVTVIAAVAGACEELYFRGVLFDDLGRRKAVLGSTVAYALVTAATGIFLLFFAAAVLGLLAAWLRERFDSVFACIVFHLSWSLSMLYLLPPILQV